MKNVDPKDLQLYRETLAGLYVMVNLIIAAPLEGLDEVTARAESLGPVLEPTIWHNNAKSIAEDRKTIKILAQARRDLLVAMPNIAPFAHIVQQTTEALAGHPGVAAALDRALRPDGHLVPPLAVLSLLIEKIARLGIQASDASKAATS